MWQWDRSDIVAPADDLNVPVDTKEPVATIDNEEITYQQWTSNLQNTYGKKLLKAMIDRQVVDRLSEQEGIEINDKVIDREVSLLYTIQGILTNEEASTLEENWRADISHRIRLEELLTKDIQIDESEIKSYYEQYKENYDLPESIQISDILVNNMETANKVISELESGAAFASLAREYSEDIDTRNQGGYKGYYNSPGEYYDLAQAMEEETYSEPFDTNEGIAIIYVHRKLPAISLNYDELRNHLKRELALEQLDQVVSADLLWENYDIKWMYGNN